MRPNDYESVAANYDRLETLALTRDPFTANCGYLWADKGGCTRRQFKWFDNREDLIHHLTRVELVRAGYGSSEAARIYAELLKVLLKVNSAGFTEPLREAINAVDWAFQIPWWGSVEQLVGGDTAIACQVVVQYLNESKSRICQSADEKRKFSKFLRSYL